MSTIWNAFDRRLRLADKEVGVRRVLAFGKLVGQKADRVGVLTNDTQTHVSASPTQLH